VALAAVLVMETELVTETEQATVTATEAATAQAAECLAVGQTMTAQYGLSCFHTQP